MKYYYQDEQITIRDIDTNDATKLFFWCLDDDINRYDPRELPKNSEQLLEECSSFCNTFSDKIAGKSVGGYIYRYFIIENSESRSIGFINLFHKESKSDEVELGVIIGDKEYWGRGVGSKSVKAIVDYGFNELELKRIYIETGEHNLAALKLFENLGFEGCGEYVEDCGFRFIVMEIMREN